ncbi:MAG: cyclic nucleotide-binding domain-containing protein [Bradyrhizobiaceae bacterium]|nr:cyclic nucleotide-binding domain-containing protein [Bradyrhizobiaceae bacterium]
MPQAFDAQNPPFDRLSHDQISQLRAALDIGYFRPGEAIIEQGQRSENLHIVIKGSVEERDGEKIEAVLGPKDTFDSRSLVHGPAGTSFVAADETLCYLVPKALVLELIAKNTGFAAFFYSEISRKLRSYGTGREDGGVDTTLRARVRDARYHPAVFVDGATTIKQAGRVMREHNNNTLLIREGNGIGIITGTDLAKRIVLEGHTLSTKIRDVCHFDVVSINIDDFIFDAVIAMTHNNKRRLAIESNGQYVGVLEDIDILGLVAGNPQLIPGQIERAHSIDDLILSTSDIQSQVERLHRQGARVEVIAEITSDLNRRLFAKVFNLTASPAIREAGCLMVMGSEGRGEQTVRTDQDNGILLSRPVPEEELQAFRDGFTHALETFGFPPCPGNVMVRNPQWSQPIDNFLRQLKSWIITPTDDSPMYLGIFFDAVSVTGPSELLDRAKSAMIELMHGEGAYLSRFARAIDQFEGASAGVFTSIMASVGVGSDEIDVKKTGTFPIVHGIRTFAIDVGLKEVSTVKRIEALAANGNLGAEMARDLVGALSYFMEIRLGSQLRAMKTGKRELEAIVRLNELSTRDRDLLRDALRVVKRFREVVRSRYHLTVF